MKARFLSTSKKGELEQVLELAKSHPAIREFPNLWTRWGNWEAYPPIIAWNYSLLGGGVNIVGLHAVTFNRRNPYTNSYYIFVHPDYEGQGVGGVMLEETLRQSRIAGNTRFKNLVPEDSPGLAFWTGFGLRPLFKDDKGVYRFDINLAGVHSVKDLIQNGLNGRLFDLSTVPKSSWNQYLKACPNLKGRLKGHWWKSRRGRIDR